MSLDYRPDWQPRAPGILVAANNLVPDKSGCYFTSYAAESSGYTGAIVASGSIVGARMVKSPTTQRLVVGSQDKLLEANGAGGWTDRSGAAYGLSGSQRWWFTQFGTETIACSLGNNTQKSTTGNFSDLSGAPKAKIMLSLNGHLLALNYNDGSASPAGIKWCTQNDDTTWTAATGNSAGTATLRESPGEITAGAEFHNIAIVWKSRSMYIGRRVGGVDIWRFDLLDPKVGCVGPEAWASTPVGIIWASEIGIFLYDGSSPRPIDDGIRGAIYNAMSVPASVEVSHDDSEGTVFFWFSTTNICYCYNYLSDKWSIAYSSTNNLGNATYAAFITHVRDANYIDALALAVTAPASSLRTAHLIISTGQKLANLSNKTIANTFNSIFVTGLVRAQQAGPREWTEIAEINPLWAYKSLAAAEASSGSVSITPYSRKSGATASALQAKTGTLTADKRFDVQASGAVLQATYTFTDQYLGVEDFEYQFNRAGKK